jgi:hypothetical protein
MPVAARPDVVAAVVARLRTFTEITDLTSTRITARLQPSWSGMPTYAVLIRPAGGPPGKPQINLLVSRLDLFCYGATEAQAAALWRQVDAILCPGQERLTKFTQGDCHVGVIVRESMPTSGIEDDTRWPRTTASYLATWTGVAV